MVLKESIATNDIALNRINMEIEMLAKIVNISVDANDKANQS